MEDFVAPFWNLEIAIQAPDVHSVDDVSILKVQAKHCTPYNTLFGGVHAYFVTRALAARRVRRCGMTRGTVKIEYLTPVCAQETVAFLPNEDGSATGEVAGTPVVSASGDLVFSTLTLERQPQRAFFSADVVRRPRQLEYYLPDEVDWLFGSLSLLDLGTWQFGMDEIPHARFVTRSLEVTFLDCIAPGELSLVFTARDGFVSGRSSGTICATLFAGSRKLATAAALLVNVDLATLRSKAL